MSFYAKATMFLCCCASADDLIFFSTALFFWSDIPQELVQHSKYLECTPVPPNFSQSRVLISTLWRE